jgi:phosphoglycolate phosphatase-like HAD superfamily hydrolase
VEKWNVEIMDMMESDKKIRAIIWDYDGTLVDTRLKNYNVTKRIIKDMTGISPERFSALKSLESYISANHRAANWRDLYKEEFAFTEEEIDYSGKLWTPYQLDDKAPVPFFKGIQNVIRSLRLFPQGIVSQNSKNGIIKQLEDNNLTEYFSYIIGYEEVSLNKQKPEPDGLLECIEKLASEHSGYIVYIGDHETDVICAHKANQHIYNANPGLNIFTIGAFYGFFVDNSSWRCQPDFIAKKPKNILQVLTKIK